MAHQIGMFAMVEGAAMEAFLNDKKVPGSNLLEKVDNYCKMYKVPPEIQQRMHAIRTNRNKVAHGSDEQLVKLDYISADMKAYQSYYYTTKGKAGKTLAFNVDLQHGKIERVRKPHSKASPGVQKPKFDDPTSPKPPKAHKAPHDGSPRHASPKPAPAPAPVGDKKPSPAPRKDQELVSETHRGMDAPRPAKRTAPPAQAPAARASSSSSSSSTQRAARPTQQQQPRSPKPQASPSKLATATTTERPTTGTGSAHPNRSPAPHHQHTAKPSGSTAHSTGSRQQQPKSGDHHTKRPHK